MIKQQINVEILLGDIEMHLPSDKGKTGAEFQQEPFKVPDQPRFQFPFAEGLVQGQEIEDIGVFQGILGESCACGSGSRVSKLVTAAPWRLWAWDLIMRAGVSQLHPWAIACRAYQKRVGKSLSF